MDFTISPLTGVASALAWHGFQVAVRRKPDRPVMRRDLSGLA
jgi:hypothetical protein